MKGVQNGKSPRILGWGQAADRPETTSDPSAADSLQSSKIVIEEPSAVFAHLSFGIKRYRCGHGIFDASPPAYQNVRQGDLFNCPLPATLAAMAFTKKLTTTITIRELRRTAYSKQGDEEIKVDRYFEVTFPDKTTLRVTDYFWGSGSCQLAYAKSKPKKGTAKELWVALIEKAFVKHRASNSYNEVVDAEKGPDINTVYETLTGDVANVTIPAHTEDEQLKELIKKAKTTPMIARYPGEGDANTAHGYALLGMSEVVSDKVVMYNAMTGTTGPVSLNNFKKDCSHVFHD